MSSEADGSRSEVGRDIRYSRQMLLPQIGSGGQERLSHSRVAVVGCGALGSFHASLLARAGVGYLRLIDRDVVEISNLQRQVLYSEADVGSPKALAATARLRKINSAIVIDPRVVDFTAGNAEDLGSGVDLVLDGTDNFATCFIINDDCVKIGIPWVYCGVVGVVGIVMAVMPGGPCLRCLASQPSQTSMESCDVDGVLNAAVTAVSACVVAEVFRILVGCSFPAGLQRLDVWRGEASTIAVDRDPECPCCVSRDFTFLEASVGELLIRFCRRNMVQISFPVPFADEMEPLAQRLAGIASVQRQDGVLHVAVDDITLTVFIDGRVLVRGTEDPGRARARCSHYVGR